MRTIRRCLAVAVCLPGLALALPLSGQVAPPSTDPAPPARPAAAERFSLGLRGVYFVENQGQWSDASVCFGLKSRGLDVAFRESSFTMHVSREQGSTSRAREEAVLGVEGEDAPAEFDAAYSLASDYGGQLADLRAPLSRGRRAPLPHGRGSSGEPAEYEHLTLTVSFPGSNAVTPRGAQEQTAKFNYFVGGEGRGIASNVPSFGAVIYKDLYDGIDLLVAGNDDGVMKYEFHCEPGADYTQIRIHYDGIDSLCVNADGDLEIATTFGTLLDGAPIVWQEDGSTSRAGHTTSRAREEAGSTPSPGSAGEGRGGGDLASLIDTTSRAREEAVLDAARAAPLPDSRGPSAPTLPARFELIDDHTYRIALDSAPDPTLPLVIDPEVEWMYYLGGRGDDFGQGIAVDSAGNALVTGETRSSNFVGRSNWYFGLFDAFALKVSPVGQLEWMTYLGGSEVDRGNGIAVDGTGAALVTGYTRSTDFAGRNNSHHGSSDAFAVKVSPSGQVQWMTYLGGSTVEEGYGIAVDSAGNALVTGETYSTDFAGRNNSYYGSRDAFAVKVSPSGEVQWMTYLGGSSAEMGYGIAADGAGNALVTGYTISTNFAGRNNTCYGCGYPNGDAFALKVSAEGQIQWMTYLGGADREEGQGIAVDGAGNALVTGYTWSWDFAGRNNSNHGGFDAEDAFALKVSPSGQLQWMTYLGGSGREEGRGIAVDGAGNALLTGWTNSTDFAARNNSHYGSSDAFALKVSMSGQVEWMTYLGGASLDGGIGIAVDGTGAAQVTGSTRSTDFAGQNNSHYGGDYDAYLVKLRVGDAPRFTVAATCPSGGPIRIEWSGASPGGQVALIFARNTGSFIIPNNRPCAGTQLGLGSNQIQLAFQGGAGANGSRTLNANAGPGACGGYLQLLDLTTCATSNVARVE